MKIITSGIEVIRARPDIYLGGRKPTSAVLACELIFSALVSGARRVEIRVMELQWTAVVADADWISQSMIGHFKDRPIEELVKLMIPWEEGGPNAIRLEVIVAAFSSGLAVKSDRRWLPVVGELPPQEIRDKMSDIEFAIVFHPGAAGYYSTILMAYAAGKAIRLNLVTTNGFCHIIELFVSG